VKSIAFTLVEPPTVLPWGNSIDRPRRGPEVTVECKTRREAGRDEGLLKAVISLFPNSNGFEFTSGVVEEGEEVEEIGEDSSARTAI